jgi:hypothetical protein
MYKNPFTIPARAVLADWLIDRHYSAHAREAITGHVAMHGTLAGSMIEPEDEGEATEVFISAIPAIDFDDPVWGRDDAVIIDVELAGRGEHPWPYGPTIGDDDREFPDFADAMDAMDAEHPLPSPGDLRSPEDWEDYRRHFDGAEKLYGYE